MRTTRRHRRPSPRPCALEALESRALLAATTPTASLFAAFGSPGTHAQFHNALATDAAGDVYAAGNFDKTIDLNPSPDDQFILTAGGNGANHDFFIAKYDADGALLWARQFAGGPQSGGDVAGDPMLAVSPAGDVCAALEFGGTFDANPGAGVFPLVDDPGDPGGGLAILRLDPTGAFVTANQLATPGQGMIPVGIALDAAGRVYVAATSFVPYVSGPYVADYDALLFSLSPNLRVRYGLRWGADGHKTEPNSLAVNPDGSAYLAGETWTGTDFHPSRRRVRTVPAAFDDRNGFLVRINPAGQFDWLLGMNGGVADSPPSFDAVAPDGAGGVYLTGGYTPGVDFNPSPRHAYRLPTYNQHYIDAFVAHYDPHAALARAWNLGPTGDLYEPSSLAVDPDTHQVIVTGNLQTQSYETDPTGGKRLRDTHGGFAAFVAAYTPRGRLVHAQAVQPVGFSVWPARSLIPAPAPGGVLYLFGRTDDPSPVAFQPGQPDQSIDLPTDGLFILKLQ